MTAFNSGGSKKTFPIQRIKKHPNGNEYLLTPSGNWVRNFASTAPCVDINETILPADRHTFMENEVKNGFSKYPWIDSENFWHDKAVIVSDGFGFSEKQQILAGLPKSVALIGVNGALAKWNIKGRSLNYYVVNNPYEECMRYLPKGGTLPKCIASARTRHQFLSAYRGTKYRYYPVNEMGYTTLGESEVGWQVDDYRNPICAAVGLCYKFGVEKLVLFCCDDSFGDERPGAVKLECGAWMYPQQQVAHDFMEGNICWLASQQYREVAVRNFSSGPLCRNAPYINGEEIAKFFEGNS